VTVEERSPFPPEAFEKLAANESANWWFRSRNRILLWVLKNRCIGFQDFLEIGCGTGFVLEGVRETFPDAGLFGTEYYEEGLTHARKRIPSATFAQLDARTMEDESRYDVIGAFDVIEHINEDQLVLNNLARALRPGGKLLITVPQHQWLWSVADEYACHVRRYGRDEMVGKIRRAGLQVQYVTSFVSLLVPLMWLARSRTRREDYDPMREFQLPDWQNRLLEAVMGFELTLLKMGMRLPVGGSLLVLAGKS
jgi:SAM-dependent methyltransferase